MFKNSLALSCLEEAWQAQKNFDDLMKLYQGLLQTYRTTVRLLAEADAEIERRRVNSASACGGEEMSG